MLSLSTRARRAILSAVIVLGFAATAAAQDTGQWTSLVQGDSLDGWVQRGGGAKYTVENGEVIGHAVVDSKNSFLCTKKTYGDFELELDFKVDPRLNSGVQIRSNSVPGVRDGVVHGYQIEIDPSERAWSAGLYDESRRGWLQSLEKNETAQKAFKQNEWNHLRIVAVGDSIKTWLNDMPVTDFHDSLTRTGFIALQVHATDKDEPMEVRWRNIRIKDLGIPSQKRPADAVVLLSDAGDVSKWQVVNKPGSAIGWKFHDGFLEVEPSAGSIETRQPFGDCQLHVEFCVDDNGKTGQENGNSGVYLQGRYEVQVLNSAGQEPQDNICGAIYRVKAPDYNMALPAGQWQTYDITFHAPKWDADGKKTGNARITVYHNGTRVQDNIEVPDHTGSGKGEAPGDASLLLQDHGNHIRYRNIWYTPLHD